MKVSAQYAQENFEEITSAAYNGETIEIEAPQKSTLRLVSSQLPVSAHTRSDLFGSCDGIIKLPSEEEWRAMDEQIANDMLLN